MYWKYVWILLYIEFDSKLFEIYLLMIKEIRREVIRFLRILFDILLE